MNLDNRVQDIEIQWKKVSSDSLVLYEIASSVDLQIKIPLYKNRTTCVHYLRTRSTISGLCSAKFVNRLSVY
jgi:hypothetical protein